MQVQTQIQTHLKIPDLIYNTWGSFGQYELDYLILPNDTRIDPRRFYHDGKTRLQLNEYEVVMNVHVNDSRKNAHRKIEILAIKPRPKYVIIVHEYKSSRNFRRNIKIIYEDGREEEPELITDIVSEEVKKDRFIYKYEKQITYVQIYDNKHIVNINKIFVGKELLTKPKIIVKKIDDTVYVKGDTYYVKDRLKELKMKWDPLHREWHGKVDIEEVVETLRDVAEIEVKG